MRYPLDFRWGGTKKQKTDRHTGEIKSRPFKCTSTNGQIEIEKNKLNLKFSNKNSKNQIKFILEIRNVKRWDNNLIVE